MTTALQPRNSVSKFRLRGFLCEKCGNHQLVFGEDAAPTQCLACGEVGLLKLEWDNVITQTTHVEPVPITTPGMADPHQTT